MGFCRYWSRVILNDEQREHNISTTSVPNSFGNNSFPYLCCICIEPDYYCIKSLASSFLFFFLQGFIIVYLLQDMFSNQEIRKESSIGIQWNSWKDFFRYSTFWKASYTCEFICNKFSKSSIIIFKGKTDYIFCYSKEGNEGMKFMCLMNLVLNIYVYVSWLIQKYFSIWFSGCTNIVSFSFNNSICIRGFIYRIRWIIILVLHEWWSNFCSVFEYDFSNGTLLFTESEPWYGKVVWTSNSCKQFIQVQSFFTWNGVEP